MPKALHLLSWWEVVVSVRAAGTVLQHSQSWMEFGWGKQRTPKAVQGGGCREEFWSILVKVLGTEWLLQAQLVTNWPSEFISALEWKGNISSPHAAQSAAELIPNVHNS